MKRFWRWVSAEDGGLYMALAALLAICVILIGVLIVRSINLEARLLNTCLEETKGLSAKGDILTLSDEAFRALIYDSDGEQWGVLTFDRSGNCQLERK